MATKLIDFLNEAKRKELKTHTIQVKLVDFSTDKDEPAYDVEVTVDGKPVMGGGKKQIFSIPRLGGKDKAKKAAEGRIKDILLQFKQIAEE